MKLRWYLSAVVYSLFMLLAILVNVFLPLAAKSYMGYVNNGQSRGVEPRLPWWLAWFMTIDNSLLGDDNFKAKHDGGYWSQVAWLYRNPVYGFAIALGTNPDNPYAYENNFTWWIFRCRTGWLLSGGLLGMFLLSIRLKKVSA